MTSRSLRRCEALRSSSARASPRIRYPSSRSRHGGASRARTRRPKPVSPVTCSREPVPEIAGLAAIERGRELPQSANVFGEEVPVPRLATRAEEQAALVGGQRPGTKREAIEHRKVTQRLVANLAARKEHSLFEPSHELGTIPQSPLRRRRTASPQVDGLRGREIREDATPVAGVLNLLARGEAPFESHATHHRWQTRQPSSSLCVSRASTKTSINGPVGSVTLAGLHDLQMTAPHLLGAAPKVQLSGALYRLRMRRPVPRENRRRPRRTSALSERCGRDDGL